MRSMLDHSLLSPSGRVSGRAHKATLKREIDRCFGGEHLITAESLRIVAQPTDLERLERNAAMCRDLAARGFKARKMTAQAEEAEARIAELLNPKT